MDEVKYWIFTFGYGQRHQNGYVKIIDPDFGSARQKMIDRYGLEWAFQYSDKEWSDWEERRPPYIPAEYLVEVIE